MYLFSPARCLSTFSSRHFSAMLLTLLLYHHYNIFRTFLLPYECKERVNISKNINSFPVLSVYLYFSVPLGRNFLGSITKFLCKIQFSTCLIDSNAAGRKIACQDIRCMGGRSHQASTTLCAESYPFARFSPHISSLFTVYQSLPFGLV